jgi:hypothetical protein
MNEEGHLHLLYRALDSFRRFDTDISQELSFEEFSSSQGLQIDQQAFTESRTSTYHKG